MAAAAGRGSPPRTRKFVALLGALFVCFSSDFIFFVILDKMSVRDVKIERATLTVLGALQKVQFGFCFFPGWQLGLGRMNLRCWLWKRLEQLVS